jgi:hypothetical protein
MHHGSIFRQAPQSDSLKLDVVMHTLFLIATAACLLLFTPSPYDVGGSGW